eukprot:scaffold16728_cov60-Attheya_sp.AAC.2
MDANADVMDKDFQKLLADTGLIDLMANQLGNQLPETYNRGSTTLDHCFGSPRLAKAVERAGYLAYNDGIPTDHRGMVLDFNRAKQYRQQASTNIISNNILKRALAIEEDAKSGFTTELKTELEKVDADLNKILLDAEGQIATHSYIPWSPELHKAYEVWKYWRIRLSNLKTKRIPGKRAKQLLERLSNQHEVLQGDSKRSVTGQLRKARSVLLKCRQSITELQQAHMEKIAVLYEVDNDAKRAKIVKRIMRAEAQAAMYKNLRKYLRPGSQSITYVEISENPHEDPKVATKWKKIFDKTELERILHERNRIHFSRAATDGTPFTVDPLADILHFRADTEFSEQFRAGKIDLEDLDLDDDVYSLLEELLPKQDDPTKISEDIPIKEVISGFKKWNENTTTGGRHLGHYKCWIMKRPEDEDSFSQEEFVTILITIYRICVKNKYPLKR